MAALSSLKSKLNKIKKEDTREIADPQLWMKRIRETGNRPEDWLHFIDYIKQGVTVTCTDKYQSHNFLCDLYTKAFRAINGKENRENQAYANLFIDYAEVKREHFPDDSVQILTEARNICRKFAAVHIKSAEMEAKEGDKEKAYRILMKAKILRAEPIELIEQAMKKLKSGNTDLLPAKLTDASGSAQPSPMMSDSGDTSNIIQLGSNTRDHCPDEMETAPIMLEAHKEKFISVRANSCRPAMRTYNSTPEMRNINEVPWKRKDLAMPKRIRKLDLPLKTATEEAEEGFDEDTFSGFTPLEPQASSTFVSSIAQSSGYQSMMETRLTCDLSGIQSTKPTNTKLTSDLSGIQPQPTDTKLTSDLFGIPLTKDIKLTSNISGIQPQTTNTKLNNDISDIQPQTTNTKLTNDKSGIQLTKDTRLTSDITHSEGSNIQKKSTKLKMMETSDLTNKENTNPNTTGMRSEGGNVSLLKPYNRPLILVNTVEPKTSRQLSTRVEPTPSKQIQSNVSSNLPVCATPSVVNRPPVPATPSMRQDVETITVNGVVYLVLDLIGKGGSSKVYNVHDSVSKPTSKAIKVVNLNDANEEIVNGYKNEVQLLLQLQYCPKVIKIYDYEFQSEENKLYIVMEHGNADFAQFLKENIKVEGKLSDHLIRYYWYSMLMAVKALHKEGVIHSDLKPSNFIINGGQLKLIDFGIAKSVQPDKTSVLTETQVGTLNYMSPESIMDNCSGEEKPMYKISTKSDVWSLGCILYNMVYGYTPFQKIMKQFAKLQAIISESYVITFPEITDKLLMDVMKKCLIRDPKVRPSIDELLEHPYLKSEKEKEQPKRSVEDHQIERLVRKLVDRSNLTPNTVRSLVRSEIRKAPSDGNMEDIFNDY